jgi:2-oxo-4-hydroxy-4-carboxy--5-ureidoimidazoline (OHCU) decarboxylase
MMKKLGEVEHNRWVLEQLLLRYRPLTYDEQMKAKITDLYSSAMEKNRLKKVFAHLDICSNSKLKEIDCNVMELDETLIKVLPTAYTSYLKE